MKRFFATLLLSLATCIAATAQQSATTYENFYSMRFGINFSSLTSEYYTTDSQTGFNATALYNISLMEYMPLYLQSGIGITMKGARNSTFVSSAASTRFKSYSISIPAVLTYDIPVNSNIAVMPEFGLFYSYAFAGSISGDGEFLRPYKELEVITPDDEVISDKLFHRSDFGIRAGISLRLTRCMVGFSYEAGLINCFSKRLRKAGLQSNTGCWAVNLAYNFK